MQNSEVPCVRYLIGRIVKTYDYINRVVLTLPLSVYEGTWTHSPLSLLCITMILRVRRNFFEITTFPNTEHRPTAELSYACRNCAAHLTRAQIRRRSSLRGCRQYSLSFQT